MSTADTAGLCTRVYLRGARVAHLLPAHESPSGLFATALCRQRASLNHGWRGTGAQDEYDRAAALPTCLTCAGLA